MAREYRAEHVITTDDADLMPDHARPAVTTEDTRTVATDPYDTRRDGADRVAQAVGVLFGVVIALIGIRFVLLLLGANPDAGFTSFIYGVTGPLVAPFEGMFGAPDTGSGVVDPASLVAIVVYTLLGWLVTKLVWLALGDTRRAVQTHSRSVDTEIR
jgi:uncharacterized protein YggT (Ycf19 family)